VPRSFTLLAAFVLLGCRPADAPHPGTVTYKRNGVVTRVSRIEDVPERMRFADEASAGSGLKQPRRVPIVEVDARDMGPGRMEILEYGPGPALLRMTTAFTGSTAR